MKLNLRKANALQQSIQDMIGTISVQTTLTLTEFSDVDRELTETLDQADKNAARRRSLIQALYDIRKAVSKVNCYAGVDDTLAEIAMIDRMIKEISVIYTAPVKQDLDVIERRIAKMKTINPGDGYYHENSFQSGVYPKERTEEAREEILTLKKNRQQLADKLLELNITNSIVLSDDTLRVLTAERLV